MIDTLQYIISKDTNPFHNLAMEEYLLKQVSDGALLLYLWQNERTVVIGRNQNPWKECRISELERDGGRLVRRLSGGGAVFHDLGNLNFTFLAAKENYDVEKQLEVIVSAVNSLGIPAEKTGRNDITVEGRKFSGNAFYSEGNHHYHHGTILVDVNMGMLTQYLNVSRDKLKSKGVESVRSRVINLTELRQDLSIDRMKTELISALGRIYSKEPIELTLTRTQEEDILKLQEKFASWEWNLGRHMEFHDVLKSRYPWGDIELQLKLASGRIVDCRAYSDALDIDLMERVASVLIGSCYTTAGMLERIEDLTASSEQLQIKEDILAMIKNTAI